MRDVLLGNLLEEVAQRLARVAETGFLRHAYASRLLPPAGLDSTVSPAVPL